MSQGTQHSPPGICIWLTGRSGAGKTTLVRAFTPLLDTVPELAKQRFERSSEAKLARKAYVAAEVVRHGGIAICVTVSARAQTREAAKARVGAAQFLEGLRE